MDSRASTQSASSFSSCRASSAGGKRFSVAAAVSSTADRDKQEKKHTREYADLRTSL